MTSCIHHRTRWRMQLFPVTPACIYAVAKPAGSGHTLKTHQPAAAELRLQPRQPAAPWRLLVHMPPGLSEHALLPAYCQLAACKLQPFPATLLLATVVAAHEVAPDAQHTAQPQLYNRIYNWSTAYCQLVNWSTASCALRISQTAARSSRRPGRRRSTAGCSPPRTRTPAPSSASAPAPGPSGRG